MRQTINLLAFLVSGFAVGYAVGFNPAPAAISSVPAITGESFTATVSAYCACERCCPGTSDNITANGHKIQPGERFVAADKRFAFGTMLDIPGYGRVPVLDRGGAIKGDKLDVFFDDDPKTGKSGHQRALAWGVKKLQVRIER